MRLSLLKAPFVVGLLAGCMPDIPEPIWRGEHLHYSTTTSAPVCRGSFFRQEQHMVELARVLGVELSEVVPFTRVARSEIADYCAGLEVEGCAYVDSPHAFAVASFQYHELTHAVARLAGLDGALPFSEGFAQLFNDGGDPDLAQAPLDYVLRGFRGHGAYYYTAGLFARFLVERHGLAAFVELMRSTEKYDSFDQIAPVFEDIFGEPIDAAARAFESYPSCPEMSNRIALVDCNLPLTPWDGRTLTMTANVSCDQDDVLGPTSDDVVFTTRAFEIEEEGSYIFFTSMPEGWSGFRVVKCGSCWDSYDALLTPGAMEFHELTPGRYYMLLGRKLDAPAEIGAVVARI